METSAHIRDALPSLLHQAGRLGVDEMLALLRREFAGQICFSTSFSKEDQVITELIASGGHVIDLFTLDTGRLFPETYSVWNSSLERYKVQITAFLPQASLLEPFLQAKGPNSFYESVENRKACCNIRKVEPLKRALKGKSVWITGLRAGHSADRANMPLVEWDESNQILKYHPILNWTAEQVDSRIREKNIPYNPLHDRGFVSIGCQPCTRAIRPGEDFRAGRWWWENTENKECGLHVHEPHVKESSN